MDFRQAEPWSQPDVVGRSGIERPYGQVPGAFPSDIVYNQFGEPVGYVELEGSAPTELDGEARQVEDLPPKPSKKQASKRTVHSARVKPTVKPSNPIVIAVFGLTGTGKSSFINKLSGKDVKIGHGLQSCTSEIEEVQCKIGGTTVTLVDTPGFDDTTRTDTEILRLIASWMKDAYDDRTKLAGIIYLHRISDNRMSGSASKNLRMLRSLCGTQNLDHVILASTMWGEVTETDGNAREQELLQEGKFWGDLKKDGSMVRRYDYTQGGAMALVNELLQLSPIVLQIQQEIAIQKKKLNETNAGREVERALAGLEKKHLADLAEVRQELTQAMKESNSRLAEELKAERKMLDEKVKEVEANKKALRAPINRRAWYRRSWKCKKCHARLTVDRDSKDSKGVCPGCGFEQLFV